MPATEEELFDRLATLGVAVETHRHAPVYTVVQAQALRDALPGHLAGAHSKNLFLKDKKGGLWLLVALEDRPIDLKALRALLGCPPLSFASAERLRAVLGVEPGSVTPFSLINDTDGHVTVVLDAALLREQTLNFHPLANTATTAITPDGLLAFIRSCGRKPRLLEL